MSEEILNTEVTSEDNTDPTNTPEAEESTQEGTNNAEGKKIGAIIERKNKKIADLEAKLEEKAGNTSEDKKVSSDTGLSRDEAILFAKGLSDDEVDKALSIAKNEGISPREAINGDYFKFWKEKQEKKEKSKQASLGTSKGSPKAVEKTSFNTKDSSREDHKALFDANK